MDRFLYHIGRLIAWLRDASEGDGERSLLTRCSRVVALWGSILYALLLLALLLGMHFFTDRIWIFSVLVFLPPLGWLLPVVGLLPLALFCRRIALLPQVLAVLMLVAYLGFNTGLRPVAKVADGLGVRIVVNNIGSAMGSSPMPFIQQHEPDLVVLQESGRADAFAAELPDHQFATHGEFSIYSRWPILESGPVDDLAYLGNPVAARYLIAAPGQHIVVYNVHLPTRQDMLNGLRADGFLPNLEAPRGIFSATDRQRFQQELEAWIALATALAERIATESLPVLAVGDFNMPDRGAVYNRFTEQLRDAFQIAGVGYGYTVPASTRKWIALGQPWLRIDYIFIGPEWEVIDFVTEAGRLTQHRAIASRLYLRRGSGTPAAH